MKGIIIFLISIVCFSVIAEKTQVKPEDTRLLLNQAGDCYEFDFKTKGKDYFNRVHSNICKDSSPITTFYDSQSKAYDFDFLVDLVMGSCYEKDILGGDIYFKKVDVALCDNSSVDDSGRGIPEENENQPRTKPASQDPAAIKNP